MGAISGMDDDAVIRGVELRLETLIAGIESALPTSVTEVKIGTVTFTIPALVAKVQELVRPYKAKRAAHGVLRQARLNRERDREAALEFLADAKAAFVALLGRRNQELVEFGFKPEERRRGRPRSAAKPDATPADGRPGV